MIEHQRGAFDMRQRFSTELFDHLQRIARARIVNHRKIDIRDHNLTCFGRLSACVMAENFLGDGITHRLFS